MDYLQLAFDSILPLFTLKRVTNFNTFIFYSKQENSFLNLWLLFDQSIFHVAKENGNT